MALTEVIICNMALSRIGVSAQITSVGTGTLAEVTESSAAVNACNLWYVRCRNQVLQDFPWRFAIKFRTLTLADDGANEVWEDEWDSAYVYPTDCLKVMRFVTGIGAGYQGIGLEGVDWNIPLYGGTHSYEWPYAIRQHEGKKVILTDVDEDEADLQYVAEVTDASEFTELFGDALAWRLAAEISLTLGKNRGLREESLRGYALALRMAQAHSANEDSPHPEADGEFIRARGGQ